MTDDAPRRSIRINSHLLYSVGSVVLVLGVLTGLCSVVLFLAAKGIVYLLSDNSADNPLQEIEDYLGTSVPEDAVGLTYSAHYGYGFYIELRFAASPESVEQFARAFCGGSLHQGYDAFNAVDFDSAPRPPGLLLIKAQEFTYYSYSLNTSETILGNRCLDNSGEFILLISVDTSDPELHQVHLEIPTACNAASVLLPCSGPLNNYVNPISDMPFMVAGLAYTLDGFRLVTDELCVEMGWDYVNSIPESYDYLKGSQVDIQIDGQQAANAWVSQNWALVADPAEMESHSRFNFCFREDWVPGVHTMGLRIRTVEDAQYSFAWEFEVR